MHSNEWMVETEGGISEAGAAGAAGMAAVVERLHLESFLLLDVVR